MPRLKLVHRQSYCIYLSILQNCMLLVTSMTSECITTGLYSCVIVVNTHEGRLQTGVLQTDLWYLYWGGDGCR